MWTKTRSLLLSRILTMVTGGIVLILTFFVPAFSKWYEKMSLGRGLFGESGIVLPMCICLYICEILALIALFELHVLLENINREQVFTQRNTTCLRRISWACMLAGISFCCFRTVEIHISSSGNAGSHVRTYHESIEKCF